MAANSDDNKMTLTNLATIFGPNLLRPGGAGLDINIAAMDVVTPVSVVLYFLNCPEEYFDEGSARTSPDSTGIGSGGKRGGGLDDRKSPVGGMAEGAGSIVAQHRGSSSQLLVKEQWEEQQQQSPIGKVNRRSRRASGRGSKISSSASSSSIRASSSSVKHATPTSSSTSQIVPSRESVI